MQNELPSKSKNFPFTVEQFLKSFESASQRSRQILLILIFSAMLILMALVNAVPSLNWFSSRVEVNKIMLDFLEVPYNDGNYKAADTVSQTTHLSSLGEYIQWNEKANYQLEVDSATIAYYNRRYPLYAPLHLRHPKIIAVRAADKTARYEQYNRIGSAIEYLQTHYNYDHHSLQEFYNKLSDAQVEHINLVRVPILGISFDVNNLALYSGLTLAVLYTLLYLALLREHVNLEIAFKRGWGELTQHHYYFYEYASMQQVLSVPQKLFEPDQQNKSLLKLFAFFFPLGAIVSPAFIYLCVYAYDWKTVHRAWEINPPLTIFSLFITTLMMASIVFTCYHVYKKWRAMDRLWDNQAYEFNFEYILECVGLDKKIDFEGFAEKRLTEHDLPALKELWFREASLLLARTLTDKQAMKMFSRFIDKALRADLPKITVTSPRTDPYWQELYDWFEKYGRKNVGDSFQTSFLAMLQRLPQ